MVTRFPGAKLALPLLALLAGCAAPLRAGSLEQAAAPGTAAESQRTGIPVSNGAYLDRDGGRLWYLDSGGAGAPVLLLHPYTGTHEIWENQYPALVASGLRVILLDNRGAGLSDNIPATAETQITDVDALLDHLGIDQVNLVGAAAGGIQAMRYATQRPDRVRSLVLAGTIGGISDPSFTPHQQRLLGPQFHALPAEVKELGPSYRFENPEGTRRWLAIEAGSANEKLMQMPAEERDAVRQRTFSEGIPLATVGQFPSPVLLIYGGADLYSPPALGRVLQAAFQNARLVVLPEAGHAPHWERPSQFSDALLEFLAEATDHAQP